MKITLSILILLACSCTMSYAQNPLTDSIQFATTNDEISRLPDLIKDPQNRRFLSVADKYHKYPIHYYLEHFYSSDNFEEDPYYDWTTVYEG